MPDREALKGSPEALKGSPSHQSIVLRGALLTPALMNPAPLLEGVNLTTIGSARQPPWRPSAALGSPLGCPSAAPAIAFSQPGRGVCGKADSSAQRTSRPRRFRLAQRTARPTNNSPDEQLARLTSRPTDISLDGYLAWRSFKCFPDNEFHVSLPAAERVGSFQA